MEYVLFYMMFPLLDFEPDFVDMSLLVLWGWLTKYQDDYCKT